MTSGKIRFLGNHGAAVRQGRRALVLCLAFVLLSAVVLALPLHAKAAGGPAPAAAGQTRGTMTYDAETNVLTLENYHGRMIFADLDNAGKLTLHCGNNVADVPKTYTCPDTSGNLTLRLVGDSVLEDLNIYMGFSFSGAGTLTVEGPGSLTVRQTAVSPGSDAHHGFHSKGSIVVNSGTLDIAGGDTKSSTSTIFQPGAAIFSSEGDIIINGGNITAGAGSAEADTPAGRSGVGICARRIIISGGTVRATANTMLDHAAVAFEGVYITGGSFAPSPVKWAYVNGDAEAVHPLVVALPGAAPGAEVTSIKAYKEGGAPIAYGTSGLVADVDGSITLWLPEGAIVASVALQSGTVLSGPWGPPKALPFVGAKPEPLSPSGEPAPMPEPEPTPAPEPEPEPPPPPKPCHTGSIPLVPPGGYDFWHSVLTPLLELSPNGCLEADATGLEYVPHYILQALYGTNKTLHIIRGEERYTLSGATVGRLAVDHNHRFADLQALGFGG